MVLYLRRVFVLGRTLGLEESIAEEYSTYNDIVLEVFICTGRTPGLEESIAEEYSTYKDIVQVNLKGLHQSAMKILRLGRA